MTENLYAKFCGMAEIFLWFMTPFPADVFLRGLNLALCLFWDLPNHICILHALCTIITGDVMF